MNELTNIVIEYYYLFCERIYLLSFSKGMLKDIGTFQFVENNILCINHFKYIDIGDIVNCLGSLIDDNNLNNQLINYLKNIIIFVKKYNIDSFDEIETKILELWEQKHMENEVLLKYIIRIDSDKLYKIYIDMVKEDLIKNPNFPVGTSNEPLFTMLPKNERLLTYNLKAISSSSVDWRILRNGTIALEYFIYEYELSKDEVLRKYYHDVIMIAIRGNMCVYGNKYVKMAGGIVFQKEIGLYLLSLYDDVGICGLHERLRGENFIEEIKEYLISDSGYNHQLELYKEFNHQGDRGLKQIKTFRRDK